MKIRLFLIAIFFIILGTNVGYTQLPFGHGICYTVVDDTADIDIAQNGIVWFSRVDSSFWFTNGAVKYRVPVYSADTLSTVKLKVDTLEALSTDSIFVNDDFVLLMNLVLKATSSNMMYFMNSSGDTVMVLDPNASGGPTLFMMDGSHADTIRFWQDGDKFNIVPDAGTAKIDVDGTFEADSIRSEDGNFIYDDTNDKTLILMARVTDSLYVGKTSKFIGDVTLNEDLFIDDSLDADGVLQISPILDSVAVNDKLTTAAMTQIGDNLPLYLNEFNPFVGMNLFYSGGWLYGQGSSADWGGWFGQYSNNASGNFVIALTTSQGDEFTTATPVERFSIMPTNGYVGIGKTSPTNLLEVFGDKLADTLLVICNDKIGRDSSIVVTSVGGLVTSGDVTSGGSLTVSGLSTNLSSCTNLYLPHGYISSTSARFLNTTTGKANSLTLGDKDEVGDLLITRENTPAGTDSSVYATVDDGNGKIYTKSGDADSTVLYTDNSNAYLKSNNPITLSTATVNLPDSLTGDSGNFLYSGANDSLYTVELKVDGTATIDNLDLNGGQISGNLKYDKISIGADQLSGLTTDTLWIPNPENTTITFDSVRCTAGSDDQDFEFVRKNWIGGGIVEITTATASTDGYGMYYTTQTSFTTSAVAAGQFVGIAKPSGVSEWETVEMYYHFTEIEM